MGRENLEKKIVLKDIEKNPRFVFLLLFVKYYHRKLMVMVMAMVILKNDNSKKKSRKKHIFMIIMVVNILLTIWDFLVLVLLSAHLKKLSRLSNAGLKNF